MNVNKKLEQTPDTRCLDAVGNMLTGQALIDRVRDLAGDTILLSFSCGKDSLALWLHLRDHFEIIPYYLYHVPGLQYVEQSLDYYEDWFGARIVRLPHPLFYDMFRTCAYQPVHRVGIIESLNLPRFDFADIDDIMAAYLGLENPFTAIGFRAADNIQRHRLLKQMGPLGFKRRRYFYGVWDWTVDDVTECIRKHDIAIPADYQHWGRTIASFGYPELSAIKRAYPADYDVIRTWFPLVDVEMFRYEQVGQA